MQSTILGFCWSDLIWRKSFEFREIKDFLCPSDTHFQIFISTIVSIEEFIREIEETEGLQWRYWIKDMDQDFSGKAFFSYCLFSFVHIANSFYTFQYLLSTFFFFGKILPHLG